MITGHEKISDVFSILHDGVIIASRSADKNITLEVEIEYLTQRIHPSYTKFFVVLHHVSDLVFKTWPNDLQALPSTIYELSEIFFGEPDILEGRMTDGLIEIILNHGSGQQAFGGGNLFLKADAVSVTDEGGKEYTLSELAALCDGYWSEWESKKKQ